MRATLQNAIERLRGTTRALEGLGELSAAAPAQEDFSATWGHGNAI